MFRFSTRTQKKTSADRHALVPVSRSGVVTHPVPLSSGQQWAGTRTGGAGPSRDATNYDERQLASKLTTITKACYRTREISTKNKQ